MRLNTALTTAVFSTALLASNAWADDVDDSEPSSSTTIEETTTTSIVERPTFTATDLKAPFLEQFTDKWETRWKASHAKKEDSKATEEWAYVGEWAVEEAEVFKAIEGDKGLVVKNPAAHHAISAKFPKKIDNKGKTLVVQYEVKLQKGLECGGAYLKLLQDNKKLHREEFSNASPYIIMFGPDKCGGTNKVHFIFRHKNPKTGEYEEKHLRNPPAARIVKTTTLYTLIVNEDNTFEILIDGESSKAGNLLDDFLPTVNPEKEIDDPNDKKPEDWVDEARIPDPEAKKPDDWDEDAPIEIPDEEATKPDDWLDDEPTMIPDPEAEKPEDWDDEEDGDWIPPQVPNPKCEEASGCGKWERPSKRNPEYKGKWSPEYIDNPAYKGIWKPRKIANPDYYEDKTPSKFEPMGAIGFEIWTMQSDILFDNIYIGHSVEDATKFKNQTFDIKHKIEKAEEDASKPPPPETPDAPEAEKAFKEDPVGFIREKVDLFWDAAKDDPVQAVKVFPEVAGGIGAVATLILALAITALAGLGSKGTPPKVKEGAEKLKEKAIEAKDQAADAATTGADKLQSEVNKRTTRSSGPAE